uniref:Uncharacterized protein n=1 Tax=Noccaea caerulescens TaxID=107243 RepID=A0A1J3HUE8_NOCCA
MKSRNKTSAVKRRLRPSYRYYPYTPVVSGKKEMKEEVVRLGVELSLHVARSMFLLCDDTGKMLVFCARLFRDVTPLRNPVLDKLLLVMHHVYFENIKLTKKKDNCGHFDQERVFALIPTAWKDFGDGIIILSRLYLALSTNSGCFDDCHLSWAIVKFKRDVLKKLEDKLKDVNGFARETIESNIFQVWKPLFDEEADEDKEAAKVVLSRRLRELFTPLSEKKKGDDIPGLVRIPSPYILGEHFTTLEAKKELVKLGVEFCLYVAQSMFLLCDNIGTLLGFCNGMRVAARRAATAVGLSESHVVDRLLLVMHHVYFRYIEPKIGVYQDDGEESESVQFESVLKAGGDFLAGLRHLNSAAHSLRGGGKGGRKLTRPVEKMVKKVEEKLGLVEKLGVAEANGFDRDAIEPDVLGIWKSLFDVEAKEATETLQAIKNGIISDLFQNTDADLEQV